MRSGERVTVPLVIEGTSHGLCPATVIYIHPAGRFYTARIQLPGGSFNESFRLPDQAAGGKDRT